MAEHGVVHFEIPAGDPEELSQFYTGLFGWRIDKIPMGEDFFYYMASTVETDEQGMPKQAGAINGGIYKKESAEQRPINYVNVESVDDYLSKATSAGATVTLGKTPIPGMGFFAQLLDPEGNQFGLFETNPGAA